MQGGAYGAFASCDGIEQIFTFSTYRDPKSAESLRLFPKALRELSVQKQDN